MTLKTANSPFFKLSQGSETNYCCSKLIKLKNEPADVQKCIRRAKLKMARRISSIWTNRPDMKLGEIVSYSNPMCRNIWEFVWKCKLKNYIKHFVTTRRKTETIFINHFFCHNISLMTLYNFKIAPYFCKILQIIMFSPLNDKFYLKLQPKWKMT